MKTKAEKPFNIFDPIYYYDPQNGWTLSEVISCRPHNVIVAQYGPPLKFTHVLLDIDYTLKKRNGELVDYTATLLNNETPNKK